MEPIKYFASFLLAAGVVYGIVLGGAWVWSGVALLFLIHPTLDWLIGKKTAPEAETPSAKGYRHFAFDVLLIATPFLLTALLVYSIAHAARAELSLAEQIGTILSTGLVTGFLGISTAHELIHRQNQFQRWCGYWLLYLVKFGHWAVEHVNVHHKYVGTKNDPANPYRNEWLYSYWLRAYFSGLKHSFEFEQERLKRNASWLQRTFKNRVIVSTLFQLTFAAISFHAFGIIGLLAYLGQAVVAILLLKSVDYIEHYGLWRRKVPGAIVDPITDEVSWDCEYKLTNWTLLNLGYHAIHHRKPLIPYQDLVVSFGPNRMPLGYSGMIIMALVPPLFFRVMNWRIPAGIIEPARA